MDSDSVCCNNNHRKHVSICCTHVTYNQPAAEKLHDLREHDRVLHVQKSDVPHSVGIVNIGISEINLSFWLSDETLTTHPSKEAAIVSHIQCCFQIGFFFKVLNCILPFLKPWSPTPLFCTGTYSLTFLKQMFSVELVFLLKTLLFWKSKLVSVLCTHGNRSYLV